MKLRSSKLMPFMVLILVGTSFAKRHPRKTGAQFEEWQKRYLEKIQLLAREGGLPEEEWRGITKYDKDVCYEKQCLDSALEIATATNFTVYPCKPNMWLSYVCARRVNGADNINQLERLMQTVDAQTREMLEDKTGAHDGDFLFKEAQTYYHQCKNKAANDDQDVKDILEYMSKNYGEWPIFANREPGEKFDWLDMIADMNRIERVGFKPFVFLATMNNNGQLELGIGKTSFSISSEDYTPMLQITQKRSGRKKPARLEQLEGMLNFVNNLNIIATMPNYQTGDQLITIQDLQDKTDKYLNSINMKMNIDWLRFFQRVYEGPGSDIKVSPDTPISITLPIDTIMSIISSVNYSLTHDKKSVANALHLQMVSMLLQESTVLLDDLNVFKCTEETGPREQSLSRTKEIFGYSLGKTYLKTYYDESKSTPAIKDLMEKIRLGYLDSIDDTKWMENKTNIYLKDKIKSMNFFIAEPNWTKKPNGLKNFYRGFKGSRDESTSYPLIYLSVTSWAKMKKNSWMNNLAKTILSGKQYHIYGSEWSRYLGTVQAQFHKIINEARIEGGIVQAPLFEVGRPGFMNFGGLGMVLAHEIGHSFDTQGRTFNKHGQAGEFWDKKSVALYNTWVQRVAADYGSTEHNVSETSKEKINGWKTVNEDISDILAIYISHFSYEEYLKELKKQGKRERVLSGLKSFTPQKLFYMKYGNMWCDKKDVQDSYNDLLAGHSSGNTRATLPLKRSKQFAETFGCPIPKDFD